MGPGREVGGIVTTVTDTAMERRLRLREEREIVRPHRGRLEWRVIVEFLVNFGAFVAVTVLALTGVIPLWLGLVLNALACALIYMPLHEAVHLNIAGDRRDLMWVDEVIGRLSGLIFAFGFREHRISHMRHHAHTNDPARDPDWVVAGSFWMIPVKLGVGSAIRLLTPMFVLVPPTRRLIPKWVQSLLASGDAGPESFTLTVRRNFVESVLVFGSFFVGLGWEFLFLWYLPTRVGLVWVGFVFGWYPHHPHDTRERYRDTRVATFPGSTFLIRGHDHHLLHHLYPRVAHYRLPALWDDIGPLLIQRGARVEGDASPVGDPIVWR